MHSAASAAGLRCGTRIATGMDDHAASSGFSEDVPPFLRAPLSSPCVAGLFGVHLVAWGEGTVTLAIDNRPELGHMPGWFQGAITSAIAEYAAALSGMTIAPERPGATLQQNIHFTGPARGSRLIATGRVLSAGHTISTTAAEVSVERDGALYHCATMTMTLAHRSPKTE